MSGPLAGGPGPRLVAVLDVLPVRGPRGGSTVPEEAARLEAAGVDEVALAAPEGVDPAFLAVLERTAARLRLPLLVRADPGDLDALRALFASGADRVLLGPGIVAVPALLAAAATRFGPARAAVELAVALRRFGEAPGPRTPAWARARPDLAAGPGAAEAAGANGVATGLDLVAWAGEAARRGAGELLLGTVDGEDLAPSLVRAVTRAAAVPVAIRASVPSEGLAALLQDGTADAIVVPAPDPGTVAAWRRLLARPGPLPAAKVAVSPRPAP